MDSSKSRPGPERPGMLRLVTWGALVAVLAAGCGSSNGDRPSGPSSYDALDGETLDAGRWLTPEYARTLTGGKAHLSVRATGMQGFPVQGQVYTSRLTVQTAGGARVTTLQAEVSVPAATASRSGSAAISGAVRLRYQPPADRGMSFPGALRNALVASLEVYDDGAGPVIRRRVSHCDDDACITSGTSGISLVDPAGFTPADVQATAPAAYDTAYTLALSVNEASGVFTWTVQGGAFGAGVSGTADVATWLGTRGMTLASGWVGAELAARALDRAAAGGGSGAVTATFDDVRVGTNGAPAALHDDFSGSPSSEATGFSIDRWGRNANASVEVSGGALHLRASAVTTAGVSSASPWTTVDAMRPAPHDTWQADLAILANPAASLHLGGSFLSDGTAGGPNDETGDILSNVVLSSGAAHVRIMRCADPDCVATPLIASYALPSSPARPLGVGTLHTVSQRWDPARRVFTYRLDDAAPLDVDYFTTRTTALPRVAARYFGLGFTVSGPAGAAGSAEAIVRNVKFAR